MIDLNAVRLVTVRPEVSKGLMHDGPSIPQGERYIFDKPNSIVINPNYIHCHSAA
jgi:hypothetical protein